jgi:hypothetical protein
MQFQRFFRLRADDHFSTHSRIFSERLPIQLRHHNLDIVPVRQSIPRHTHRGHRSVMAYRVESLARQLVDELEVGLLLGVAGGGLAF